MSKHERRDLYRELSDDEIRTEMAEMILETKDNYPYLPSEAVVLAERNRARFLSVFRYTFEECTGAPYIEYTHWSRYDLAVSPLAIAMTLDTELIEPGKSFSRLPLIADFPTGESLLRETSVLCKDNLMNYRVLLKGFKDRDGIYGHLGKRRSRAGSLDLYVLPRPEPTLVKPDVKII